MPDNRNEGRFDRDRFNRDHFRHDVGFGDILGYLYDGYRRDYPDDFLVEEPERPIIVDEDRGRPFGLEKGIGRK